MRHLLSWLSAIDYSTSLRRVDAFLHFECASDQANLLLWLYYDLDDIEPKWDLGAIE